MATHKTEKQLWATAHQRTSATMQATVVRWACSCGRIGPPIPLGHGWRSEHGARRRADNGGRRHVAAMGGR